jgi:hypothetical protein
MNIFYLIQNVYAFDSRKIFFLKIIPLYCICCYLKAINGLWEPSDQSAFGPKAFRPKHVGPNALLSFCSLLNAENWQKDSDTKCNFIALKYRTQNAILWLMALKFQTQNEILLIWNFGHKMHFYGFEVL